MTLMPVPEKHPSKKETEGWIDDLVGALCDPIIVYPSPWKDDLPDWVKTQITLERLVMNMKVMHEGGVPVGDTEALAYIFPRTMEEPLSEQWMRIYTYVFTSAMKFKKVEVSEDLKCESLSDYDMRELTDLKTWIFQKRVQHRKEKARAEQRASIQADEEKSSELKTDSVQPSFF
jgi:hypothetical protein